jgi:hypothetical protein
VSSIRRRPRLVHSVDPIGFDAAVAEILTAATDTQRACEREIGQGREKWEESKE